MRPIVRGLLAAAVTLIATSVLAGIGYLAIALPNVGHPRISPIRETPERIERGKYLSHHVARCVSCHSTRDWNRFSGPVVPGTIGQGGQVFDHSMGYPGKFYAKNITQDDISVWSDGEVLRAVAEGVDRNGEPLFPVMPYPSYGRMDEEDMNSIVVYVRQISSVANKVPPSDADFPVNILMRTWPKPAQFQRRPPSTDRVAYGAYLTEMSACIDCHTQIKDGMRVPGKDFAGGREFPIPGRGVVRSTNITPDPETGMGNLSREAFIARFKDQDPEVNPPAELAPGAMNTTMPWTEYAGMTDDDLGAIYDYLRTLPPLKNRVELWTPPSP